MIDIQKIEGLTANQQILGFAELIISETGDRDFLNVKKLDFIMKEPKLLPNVYVFDLIPNDNKKLLFRLAGSNIDAHNNTSVMGKYFEDIYSGDNFQSDIGNLYDVSEKKEIGFLRREVHFENEFVNKRKFIKRIAFPCSSNGTDINSIIGLIVFENKEFAKDDITTTI